MERVERDWDVDLIREVFIDYFKYTCHTFIPSSSVKPQNDPSLLFCNAGMNQFKPVFLGEKEIFEPGCNNSIVTRVDGSKVPPLLKRACNSQKCIRAGGKHNDLADVGRDIYHHTFFEMLGNWSFNDYWKTKAIGYAWDLLTTKYHLDPSRIFVTYFGGDKRIGLPPDEECRNLWLRYLPSERVLPFGMDDNFWEMGDSGPCGGCTEIHYNKYAVDSGKYADAASLVNQDDPNVLEIWNLVFIEYNRMSTEDKSAYDLVPLPKRYVDTGMGLERLVSILQNKSSNYDTDVFTALFAKLSELTKKRPYEGKVGEEDDQEIDTSYRIIVDHIRTVCVCLSDDVVPGHNMRESVLRQILRRAIRVGQMHLNIREPFLWKLVDTVAKVLGKFYTNIPVNVDKIRYIIKREEDDYTKTLKSAYKALDKLLKKYVRDNINTITPKDVENMWNTHGFPKEMIEKELSLKEFSIKIE